MSADISKKYGPDDQSIKEKSPLIKFPCPIIKLTSPNALVFGVNDSSNTRLPEVAFWYMAILTPTIVFSIGLPRLSRITAW